MNGNTQVQLQVVELKTQQGDCQMLAIDLVQPAILIETATLSTLQLPPLDFNRGIILFGRAPIWLYAHLVNRCRQAAWIAIYAIQLQAAVVVKSAVATLQVGDTIAIRFNQVPGAAILIGGPPDSGKSVLSNLLRRAISQRSSQRIYLHRANWDGEGNWAYETVDRQQIGQLVARYDAKLHQHPEAAQLLPEYFRYQAESIANIRKVVDLTLVDVGGVPQMEKLPVVEQCSHYIIISHSPDRVQEWHSLCQPHLKPLAVVHSQPEMESQLLQTKPFLVMTLSIGQMLQAQTLPDELLHRVLQVCKARSTAQHHSAIQSNQSAPSD